MCGQIIPKYSLVLDHVLKHVKEREKGKMMNIGFYYYKKLRVGRLVFINLSQCCAYCRLECVSTSLEKSLKLSLAAFSNVFATLAFSRENSFALSLACCIEFFHASIDANM